MINIDATSNWSIFDYIGDDYLTLVPDFGQLSMIKQFVKGSEARSFVLAQSNWMRILLKPEAGKKTVAID